MIVISRRRRMAAAVAATTAVLLTATAPAADDSSSSDDGTIELIVDIFGYQGFGDEKLYGSTKRHPNIKIKERGKGLGVGDYNTRADPADHRRRGRR